MSNKIIRQQKNGQVYNFYLSKFMIVKIIFATDNLHFFRIGNFTGNYETQKISLLN